MMSEFDDVYLEWLERQIDEETNPRRRDFLRFIWYPTIGNFNDLYPEYEVRDFNNGFRYLDLAYRPGNAKGCIEIQDYRSHTRDIEAGRFKDLCMKQALLALDDWLFLPIAYLSIREDPGVCKQLVLSFVGKFLSNAISSSDPLAPIGQGE